MNAKRPSILMLAGTFALLTMMASPSLYADTEVQVGQRPEDTPVAPSDVSAPIEKPQVAAPETTAGETLPEAAPATTPGETLPETASPTSTDFAAHEEYPPLETTQPAPANVATPNETGSQATPPAPASTAANQEAPVEAAQPAPPTTAVLGETPNQTTEPAPATAAAQDKAQPETAGALSPYYSPYYEYWGDHSRYIRERNEARREVMQERSAQTRELADQRRKWHRLNSDSRRRWINPRGAYMNDRSRARQAYYDRLAEDRMKQFNQLYSAHPWGPYYNQ
jgi:hypothetical protein